MIFLVSGLMVLRATARAPRDTQPYLLAAFTTVLVTSAASFGSFEPWFMGAYAISAMAATAAVAFERTATDSGAKAAAPGIS